MSFHDQPPKRRLQVRTSYGKFCSPCIPHSEESWPGRDQAHEPSDEMVTSLSGRSYDEVSPLYLCQGGARTGEQHISARCWKYAEGFEP